MAFEIWETDSWILAFEDAPGKSREIAAGEKLVECALRMPA